MACPKDTLRKRFAEARTLVVPDAFDALSANLIEQAGFEALQVSGYSVAASLCLDDESDLTLEQNLSVTRRIVDAVGIPVMADGEDGYGPPAVVGEVVRRFIDAGVAAINLEDQDLHGVQGVVPIDIMKAKLEAALESRSKAGSGLILNARTDALKTAGLTEAIRRVTRYHQVGADLVFVVGIKTIDEVREVLECVDAPLSVAAGLPYNVDSLPVDALVELGVARVSLPTIALSAARQAMADALGKLASAIRN